MMRWPLTPRPSWALTRSSWPIPAMPRARASCRSPLAPCYRCRRSGWCRARGADTGDDPSRSGRPGGDGRGERGAGPPGTGAQRDRRRDRHGRHLRHRLVDRSRWSLTGARPECDGRPACAGHAARAPGCGGGQDGLMRAGRLLPSRAMGGPDGDDGDYRGAAGRCRGPGRAGSVRAAFGGRAPAGPACCGRAAGGPASPAAAYRHGPRARRLERGPAGRRGYSG